jgi:hypothetical protein
VKGLNTHHTKRTILQIIKALQQNPFPDLFFYKVGLCQNVDSKLNEVKLSLLYELKQQ